jgi:lysophospholipase L1-like esterase
MKANTLRAACSAILLGLVGSPASAQVDLTTYIAVGDSLAAGFSSNALVLHHQRNSVPHLIATQGEAVSTFEMPWISAPGIPAELMLVSLRPTVILPRSGVGAPLNAGLTRPYNNLAVPGATTADALLTTSDNGGMHDLILRGLGSQVDQAEGMRPTFITVWIGNNDVLAAAVRGRAVDGVTLTPASTFRSLYGQVIDALVGTGATVVAANLPDVTSIPFVNTLAPVVPDPVTGLPVLVGGQPVPLLGPSGPLTSDAYVTLAASSLLAQGYGIPTAQGGRARLEGGRCVGCLPDEVVIDAAEALTIISRVDANNRAIAEICQGAGVPVVDIHGLLRRGSQEGIPVGGVNINSDFLTGGLFSYDGIHPTDLGYAMAANEWIQTINANGGELPLLNLAEFMGVTSQSRRGGAVVFSPEAYQSLLRIFPRLDVPN